MNLQATGQVVPELALCAPQAPLPVSGELFHGWADDDVYEAEFYRVSSGFLVRISGLADYELSGQSLRIKATPVPGADADEITEVFKSRILPLALSERGLLVFHASCVVMEGQAQVFVGASGTGKSTLVATLSSRGVACLADDHVSLSSDPDGFLAYPSDLPVRLWEDSLARSGLASSATRNARQKWDVAVTMAREPATVGHVFVMEPGDHLKIEQLPRQQALVRLLERRFLLTVDDESVLKENLARMAELVSRVPVSLLTNPRDFDQLDALVQLVQASIHQPAVD